MGAWVGGDRADAVVEVGSFFFDVEGVGWWCFVPLGGKW